MDSALIISVVTLIALTVAVVTDLRGRTIPDSIPVGLVLLALVATWLEWHPVSFAQLGLGLGVGFVLGLLLFQIGAMGGGDGKLCASLGAVCGLGGLLEVMFATALFGGLLSVLAKRRGESSLPYAPAFALGFAATVAISRTSSARGLWSLITEGR